MTEQKQPGNVSILWPPFVLDAVSNIQGRLSIAVRLDIQCAIADEFLRVSQEFSSLVQNERANHLKALEDVGVEVARLAAENKQLREAAEEGDRPARKLPKLTALPKAKP
jgi:hypothetical protein